MENKELKLGAVLAGIVVVSIGAYIKFGKEPAPMEPAPPVDAIYTTGGAIAGTCSELQNNVRPPSGDCTDWNENGSACDDSTEDCWVNCITDMGYEGCCKCLETVEGQCDGECTNDQVSIGGAVECGCVEEGP